MTPVETALVVLIVILIVLLLILVIGLIFIMFALKKMMDQATKILGNFDGITSDLGGTLRTALTGLAMMAGRAGSEKLNEVLSRKKKR